MNKPLKPPSKDPKRYGKIVSHSRDIRQGQTHQVNAAEARLGDNAEVAKNMLILLAEHGEVMDGYVDPKAFGVKSTKYIRLKSENLMDNDEDEHTKRGRSSTLRTGCSILKQQPYPKGDTFDFRSSSIYNWQISCRGDQFADWCKELTVEIPDSMKAALGNQAVVDRR